MNLAATWTRDSTRMGAPAYVERDLHRMSPAASARPHGLCPHVSSGANPSDGRTTTGRPGGVGGGVVPPALRERGGLRHLRRGSRGAGADLEPRGGTSARLPGGRDPRPDGGPLLHPRGRARRRPPPGDAGGAGGGAGGG